jgi:protein-L-isoaspartate(D-aspartate) O-methyltransferase
MNTRDSKLTLALLLLILLICTAGGCGPPENESQPSGANPTAREQAGESVKAKNPPGEKAKPSTAAAAVVPKTFGRAEERKAMVERQLIRRDIRDGQVLAAIRRVPRHLFIPENQRPFAYQDHPVPIGLGQTISQPYIVAYMTEMLQLKKSDRVLEIGTGSGYQAAILAELVREVYSIEIVPQLGERSKKLLAKLGYRNIHVRVGDGYKGWPDKAPFDAIIVTAAPPKIPQPLLDQLAIAGRMIVPVGNLRQELVLIHHTENGYQHKNVLPVRFVPMTGEAQQ